MAKHQNHRSKDTTSGPSGLGNVIILAGATLILVSGLYFLSSKNAPYHPQVQDTDQTATDTVTRQDATPLD